MASFKPDKPLVKLSLVNNALCSSSKLKDELARDYLKRMQIKNDVQVEVDTIIWSGAYLAGKLNQLREGNSRLQTELHQSRMQVAKLQEENDALFAQVSPVQNDSRQREIPCVAQAFDIDVIFRYIFRFVSFRDLLSCTMLNKKWHGKIRDFIKNEKVCVPKMRLPCLSLEEFSLVAKTYNLPFNGLALYPHCSVNFECSNPEWSVSVDVFDQLNVKYLHIMKPSYLPFSPYGEGNIKIIEECASFKFLKQILLKKSQDIVELVVSDAISRDPATAGLFERDERNWLPNLRRLRIDSKPRDVSADFINQILSSAPNLKSIEGFIPPMCLKNLSSELKRCIGEMLISADPTLVHEYTNFEGRSVRSVTMPHYWNWDDESMKHLVMIVKSLFEKIAPTVEELNVDESVLAMMMALNFPALTKVRLMRVNYCLYFNKETGVKLLRSIDFEKLFPSLEGVEVCVAEEYNYSSNVRFLKDRVHGPSNTFICLSVITLHLKSNARLKWSVEELSGVAKLFPNVKRFFGNSVSMEVKAALWSAWPGLEFLEFTITDWFDDRQNEDHIFCGVSEKKAAQLYTKGIQFLRTYEFQPDQPSLLDLENLKTLRVRITHTGVCTGRFVTTDYNKFFLSKVTGELVFARMPELTVEIIRHHFGCLPICKYSLEHLKTFVKFVDKEPTDEIRKEFLFQNYHPRN